MVTDSMRIFHYTRYNTLYNNYDIISHGLLNLFHIKLTLKGLNSIQASKVLERVGPNKLKQAKGINWTSRFFYDVFGDFNVLIWVGGLLSLIAYGAEFTQSGTTRTKDNVSSRNKLNIFRIQYHSKALL